MATAPNVDAATVEAFGEEWQAFDQSALGQAERRRLFDGYFHNFPFDGLADAEGFDLGCGSGRWAEIFARRVGTLHCIDPAFKALAVTRRRGIPNAVHHQACAGSIPLADASQDFGYCLGVLHHVPDPQAGLNAAVGKLKPGAPFLLYLYYALDDRPAWFRLLWRASDLLRRGICRLPFRMRRAVTDGIAAMAYWPLAQLSRIAGKDMPLSSYRRHSFYTMRTDALDRFGTRVEKRFTRGEVEAMMVRAGLTGIRFSDKMPKWVALGYRKA
jgi:SAM-dependent methyltransferase